MRVHGSWTQHKPIGDLGVVQTIRYNRRTSISLAVRPNDLR
jgi:hypothetical protein